MKITGNTVFITGATSGIGFALARAFLDLENTVIVCGRNLKKLALVMQQYPLIHTIRCDITNEEEAQKTLEKIKANFSGLNILVNNAGIQYRFDFNEDDHALRKIDEEIDVNLRAVVRMTKVFLPILEKAPEAAIINVSSFLGIVPKKSAPGYCATKAAVHAFSRSLRYQLENTRIKVFEIIPPLVDTDMTKARDDDMGKISPESLAKEVMGHLEKDHYEIRAGRTKIVLMMNRFLPSLVERIAKRR